MPLPLIVSCFSKIQIGFAFLVPANLGSPGKRAIKRVCVCVCVYALPRLWKVWIGLHPSRKWHLRHLTGHAWFLSSLLLVSLTIFQGLSCNLWKGKGSNVTINLPCLGCLWLLITSTFILHLRTRNSLSHTPIHLPLQLCPYWVPFLSRDTATSMDDLICACLTTTVNVSASKVQS